MDASGELEKDLRLYYNLCQGLVDLFCRENRLIQDGTLEGLEETLDQEAELIARMRNIDLASIKNIERGLLSELKEESARLLEEALRIREKNRRFLGKKQARLANKIKNIRRGRGALGAYYSGIKQEAKLFDRRG